MRRKKPKKKLDLGPSRVARDAYNRPGGIHADQKTNNKKARKAAKQALKEQQD